MIPIRFRLDDERAKKLDKFLTQYGFTKPNASDNYRDLLDMIFQMSENQKNAKAVTQQREAIHSVDIKCDLRVKAEQLVRALDSEGKTCWREEKVYFCVQWSKGKVAKQLKLITTDVCIICSLLKAQWKAEPDNTAEEITKIKEANKKEREIEQPITVAAAPTPKPEKVMNSWDCEAKGYGVHYTVCFNCRTKDSIMYFGCLRCHPEIAKALDYWKKVSPTGKTQ